MIIGTGNDLIDIRRIKKIMLRYGPRFESRHFTELEQSKAGKLRASGAHIPFYAKRFAAKEACAKALGSGFINDIYLKDIGISTDDLGKPIIELTNGALSRLNKITPKNMYPSIHLSLSDEPPYAQAFVIIEALPT